MIPIILILIIAAFSAIAAAAYLYGANQMQAKMIVESKRREKRLANQVKVWQNVVVKRAGFGSLTPQPRKESVNTEVTAPIKVVPASQAIRERKKQPIHTVPPEVESNFLNEAASLNGHQ